jgi:hypothetical protein
MSTTLREGIHLFYVLYIKITIIYIYIIISTYTIYNNPAITNATS